MTDKQKHIGSSLDDFLAEEGHLDELTAIATKEVLAWQVQDGMRKKGLSKTKMAGRMKTSRSQLERLLDPKNGNVTLATIQKAATALGKTLRIRLEQVDVAVRAKAIDKTLVRTTARRKPSPTRNPAKKRA